jgi:hypothetical protein
MPSVQMNSRALVIAIGRYSRQLPVNRIARLSPAAAVVNASIYRPPFPPSSEEAATE